MKGGGISDIGPPDPGPGSPYKTNICNSKKGKPMARPRTSTAKAALTGADNSDRLDRIEAKLDMLLAAIHGAPSGGAELRLLSALNDASDGNWFTSGELWRLSQAEATAAVANGLPVPDLAEAIAANGISSSHGLGRWLAGRNAEEVERAGAERGGVLWCVVSEGRNRSAPRLAAAPEGKIAPCIKEIKHERIR